MKYGLWCSSTDGIERLQSAFDNSPRDSSIVLLFSITGRSVGLVRQPSFTPDQLVDTVFSGHFCGMAEMRGSLNQDHVAKTFDEPDYEGSFPVRWIYCKNVSFSQFDRVPGISHPTQKFLEMEDGAT